MSFLDWLLSFFGTSKKKNSVVMTVQGNKKNIPLPYGSGIFPSNSIGARNNNPCNIRSSSDKWVGELNSTNGFENFSDIVYGIRATFKILYTYFTKYNCNTIAKMINRFAPPSENDTTLYIQQISKWSGIGSNTPLSFNKNTWFKLVFYMALKETGIYLNENQMEKAWQLSGL